MSDSTPTSNPIESEISQTGAQSPEASPEISTQDIYRPYSKLPNPDDLANNTLSEKDKTLYVSELDPSVNEADLFEIFSTYGSVLSIRVVKDPNTNISLGYAYVNFKERADGMSHFYVHKLC